MGENAVNAGIVVTDQCWSRGDLTAMVILPGPGRLVLLEFHQVATGIRLSLGDTARSGQGSSEGFLFCFLVPLLYEHKCMSLLLTWFCCLKHHGNMHPVFNTFTPPCSPGSRREGLSLHSY